MESYPGLQDWSSEEELIDELEKKDCIIIYYELLMLEEIFSFHMDVQMTCLIAWWPLSYNNFLFLMAWVEIFRGKWLVLKKFFRAIQNFRCIRLPGLLVCLFLMLLVLVYPLNYCVSRCISLGAFSFGAMLYSCCVIHGLPYTYIEHQSSLLTLNCWIFK